MIKEFWTLAKMLFTSKPGEIDEVRLKPMEHFPLGGKDYMPWCGYLIYRKDQLAARRKDWITKEYRELKRVENYKLWFAQQSGSGLKFYWKWFFDQC